MGGVISYVDREKTALLGVPEGLLKEYGAVSAEVAEAMAQDLRPQE
jgi:nicotinamide mononucleotide (NMN) deamidase PncC